MTKAMGGGGGVRVYVTPNGGRYVKGGELMASPAAQDALAAVRAMEERDRIAQRRRTPETIPCQMCGGTGRMPLTLAFAGVCTECWGTGRVRFGKEST